jgi:DtxR family transcriptional regulator, Mn-dependent transcriptional regulator
MEVGDLSRVAQDYLKVIWTASEWGQEPIATKGLATRFATTRANVSETLRRLHDQGLLNYQPYRPAVLTPLGRRLAIDMVRRHRLLETFLVATLGYDWSEVHREAEGLEHAVSETFLSRVDELLGHPTADPHGDPIPGNDGAWAPMGQTAELVSLPAGDYLVARVSDEDSEMLALLAEVGLRPGVAVRTGGQDGKVLVAGHPVGLETGQLVGVRVFVSAPGKNW